jgi:hypothetical protein
MPAVIRRYSTRDVRKRGYERLAERAREELRRGKIDTGVPDVEGEEIG